MYLTKLGIIQKYKNYRRSKQACLKDIELNINISYLFYLARCL